MPPREELPAGSEPTEPTEATATGFHITDEASANWLLRKLANLDAEQSRVKAQSDALLKQLDADRQSLLHLYGEELEVFVRERLASNGNRRKSVHFLQGTVGFRTVPASLHLADTQAALHFAKASALPVLEFTERLKTAEYRRLAETALQERGELLPGIEVLPERETFHIKFPTANAEPS